jgi:LPS-assembly protein
VRDRAVLRSFRLMRFRTLILSILLVLVSLNAPALAGQIQPVPQLPSAPAPAPVRSEIGGCNVVGTTQALTVTRKDVETPQGREQITFLIDDVRVDCDQMQFFADRAEIHSEAGKVSADGHVLFVSGGNRISAERMEFDTRTRTGTFYEAYGIASLGERADRSLFGTQEPDAMFWGREVQKIGPRTYRIRSGGFTTCVQPTPRWEVSSGTLTLTLDDHALMTNSVFRVKGVPVMYLPIFYYPIQDDDRATGFVLPTYGASTVQGHTLRNAFFWAIGRSHDATLYHDWYSKTGFGYGGEYRYELGGGSQGRSEVFVINEHETTYTESGGTPVTLPAKRSYQINGAVNQVLGGGFRARAHADYFSDIVTQQRYHQNVQRATSRTRRFGGNVTGNWSGSVLSATLDRNDIFYADGTVTTTGGLPRITVNRGERAIGRSPFYFGASGEYVSFARRTALDDETLSDQGLTRMEVAPTLRIPFTRWPFLSINSSIAWRATYWTESLDEIALTQIPEGIGRQYFDLTARLTGPVFNRIFNTPGGGYAEKFKHVVEPTLVVQRITAVDEFDRIVKLDGNDFIVGNVTRLSYGLNNRLYAKKNVSREILSVIVGQTYYTDANASQFDQNYQSSFSGTVPTKFSPVSLQIRTSPTERVQGEFRTEWDHTVNAFRTFAATGTVNRDALQLSAGWSQRRYLPDLPGFDDPLRADHYLNASVSLRGSRNRVGATYSFNYDLRQDSFLQQRYLAYYNAQCCGFAVEYQTFNFAGGFAGVPIPQDRRFNISFTLAGIGSFSNVLGAFGGQGH